MNTTALLSFDEENQKQLEMLEAKIKKSIYYKDSFAILTTHEGYTLKGYLIDDIEQLIDTKL
ncbi:MAG: hypothetical protein HXX81_05470, partial [Campylobacterales bacterium]|nr:hypothetical protein [Campylobacterales bacterium]